MGCSIQGISHHRYRSSRFGMVLLSDQGQGLRSSNTAGSRRSTILKLKLSRCQGNRALLDLLQCRHFIQVEAHSGGTTSVSFSNETTNCASSRSENIIYGSSKRENNRRSRLDIENLTCSNSANKITCGLASSERKRWNRNDTDTRVAPSLRRTDNTRHRSSPLRLNILLIIASSVKEEGLVAEKRDDKMFRGAECGSRLL
jgi:hypothetical protein